jgi:hypothetical protein
MHPDTLSALVALSGLLMRMWDRRKDKGKDNEEG